MDEEEESGEAEEDDEKEQEGGARAEAALINADVGAAARFPPPQADHQPGRLREDYLQVTQIYKIFL